MIPTVSVIIPSYNHERFVKECIESVLNQTFQDFEIIITDDGSRDRTVEIIEGFDDPRIKLFKHPKNKGACVASNNCILNSRGKYIAMLSSDDAWYPEKLDVQVKYLDEHPEIGVVFGKVEWVDESGNPITSKKFPYMDVFDVKNRTRYEWLGYFFDKGNCLCHPCSLVRRECYSEVGLLNPSFASIPDLDLWIRICLKYDITVLDQKLIRFRRMSDESNESGDTNKNRIRNRYENRHVLNHYLKITDTNEFLQAFPKAVKYGEVTTDIIPYFLGRIAIDSGLDFKILWGLDVIYSLLQDEKTARKLEDKFNFTYLNFIMLTSECDTFRICAIPTTVQPQSLVPIGAFKMFLLASKRYGTEIYLIIIKLLSK
ncbi:MAG: glycosyltransferase [Candidatus Methanoperedens sp.]|nr:glycosyltransferase [Candidatus Methanoperedens sp.]MCZ7404839.1 glycosyltransferase [Candidatus Methanoperedens sp.]